MNIIIRFPVTIVVSLKSGHFCFSRTGDFQMLLLSGGHCNRVFEVNKDLKKRDKTIEHWVAWIPVPIDRKTCFGLSIAGASNSG